MKTINTDEDIRGLLRSEENVEQGAKLELRQEKCIKGH